MYLRMGRASDLKPVTLLHAVARRRLPSGIKYKDSFLPSAVILVSINKYEVYSKKVLLSTFVFYRQKS